MRKSKMFFDRVLFIVERLNDIAHDDEYAALYRLLDWKRKLHVTLNQELDRRMNQHSKEIKSEIQRLKNKNHNNVTMTP